MTPLLASLALLAGTAGGAAAVTRGRARLILSRAKHGSLTGHARMSRKAAKLVPGYELNGAAFFRADGAPEEVALAREAGFARLAGLYAARFPKGIALTAATRDGLSDLQFTGRYRVPFQFSRMVREHLPTPAFMARSDGFMLTDLDGNRLHDLSGSYGVNVLGHEAYKQVIAEAVTTATALGPVLGAYHPLVADNVARLLALSGLDEVSFHMSGTEAVMQAVRLARYHTGRSHLVRLCGAYHGWWGDVQPGVGNPVPADRTYTLADLSDRTLKVLETRRNIACVLVNPLQALHPNAGAPSDSTLVAGRATGRVDRAAYAAWLARVAEICRRRGIVLILDDVFTGFRLARGGAAEWLGLEPDMVTWGKTLGGGLPVGVLCGRARLMRRFREDRPADICFARGTFNAHPYVMAAMNGFLQRIDGAAGAALYAGLDETWERRAAAFNARLEADGLPVRVANLSSIWTVRFTSPSRYNWMLQYYLRAEGLHLSWVGTGRIIFSLDHGDADMTEVADRFAAAGRAMAADGWWWIPEGATDRAVRRSVLREMLQRRRDRPES